jgi:hypothetical protein
MPSYWSTSTRGCDGAGSSARAGLRAATLPAPGTVHRATDPLDPVWRTRSCGPLAVDRRQPGHAGRAPGPHPLAEAREQEPDLSLNAAVLRIGPRVGLRGARGAAGSLPPVPTRPGRGAAAGPGRPGLHRRRPQPAVGRRLHLRADLVRHGAHRVRLRCVLPADRRPAHRGVDADRVAAGRPEDGSVDPGPGPGRRSAASCTTATRAASTP